MLSHEITQWRDAGDFYNWKGHEIYFRAQDTSKQNTLLLIHGFPSASWDWQPVWDGLAEHFNLVTLDMLGFGLSDKPENFDYSISQQADLYEALIQQRNIEQCYVLAHDYGNTVAQELLARQQEHSLSFNIQRLSFLNGGLFPETHKPLLVQKLLMSPVGAILSRLMSQKKFADSLQKICSDGMTSHDIELLWQLLEYNQGRKVMPKLICYMKERRQYRSRWVGALEKSTVPLHLIDGLIDPISGQHLVDRFRQLVPQGKVTELAGIGHYPQVEAPDQVLKAYLEGIK